MLVASTSCSVLHWNMQQLIGVLVSIFGVLLYYWCASPMDLRQFAPPSLTSRFLHVTAGIPTAIVPTASVPTAPV